MAFDDAELYAAWQAGQQQPATSPSAPFSDADLYAAWQAGQAQQAEPDFFSLDTLKGFGQSIAKGASQLGGIISDVANPLSGPAIGQDIANALLGRNEPYKFDQISALSNFEKARAATIGDAVAKSAEQKYLNAVGEMLPSAILPMGGGGLLTRALSAATAGVGGEVADELGAPKWVGQTIGGAAPSAIKGIANVAATPIKALIGPSIESQADDAARAALAASGTSAEKIAAALEKKAVPKDVRVAEAINDPGLALVTKQLELKVAPAGIQGKALDADRALRQLGTIGAVQGPVQSKEVAGKVLRAGLEEGLSASKEKVKKAYTALRGAKGSIGTAQAKRAIFDFIQEEGAENIAPTALAKVDRFMKKTVNMTVDDFVEAQKQFSTAAYALGQSVKAGSAGANAPEVAAAYRLMSRAADALDDSMERAIQKKTVPTNIADKLAKAKTLRREQGELFQSYAIDDILQKERGLPRVLNSQVIGKVLNTPEEARQAFRGLKQKFLSGAEISNKRRAEATLRSALIEELKARATSATTGEFNFSSFSRSWRSMKSVAKEVLSNEQIKAIESVRRDLLSRSNFDRLARHASGDGSQTAQLLGTGAHIMAALNGTTSSFARRLPFIGDILEGMSRAKADKVKAAAEQILIDLSFDPKFAKAFANKPTKEAVGSVWAEMLNRGLISGAMPTSNKGLVSDAEASEPVAASAPAASAPAPAADPIESLVDAVIAQESGGNSRAIGYETPQTRAAGARAQGLMQLMPATGRELAKKAGVKYDPFNAEQNRMLGTMYLKQMLERFNGDVELALTAYHSGAARVQRLLDETRGKKLDDIIHLLGPAGKKYAKTILRRV